MGEIIKSGEGTEQEQEQKLITAEEVRLALGKAIRDRRKELKMTLAEISTSVGMNQSYLSVIEKGRHEISMKLLGAIAQTLDTTVGCLCSVLATQKKESEKELPETPACIMGKRLSSERRKQKLGGKDVGKILGQGIGLISALELGKSPVLSHFIRYAELLHMPLSVLFKDIPNWEMPESSVISTEEKFPSFV